MLRSILVLVTLGLLAVTAAAEETAAEKFTSAEGRFSVSFPGTPQEQEIKVESDTVTKNVRYSLARDGINYDVGFIAYAKQVADKLNALDPAEFAKRQQAATVKRTMGEILAQKDATLGKEKRPGYELLIQINPQLVLRQRAFYADGKLYQLIVTGATRDVVSSASIDKFLDSFTLAE